MRKILTFFIVLTIFVQAKDYTEIEFRGNIDTLMGDFSRATLLKVVGVSYPPFYKFWQSDPVFEDAQIPKFRDNLKAYCDSLGFYEAKITSDTDNSIIALTIQKNRPILVKSIKINDEFRKMVDLKEGKAFTTSSFKSSKSKIGRYLNETGYPKHEFEAKAFVDVDSYAVIVKYKIDKKAKCRLDKTTIKGNDRVDKKFITKKIKYRENEVFDIRKIESTYEGIYNYGVFNKILVEPILDNNSSTIPVLIDLAEGETKTLKSFIGFSTDEGFRAGGSWEDKNFFGDLKNFEVGIKGSQKGYKIYNRYYDPVIYFPLLNEVSFENYFAYEDKNYESYDEKKLEDTITFGKNYWGLNHFFGLKLEKSEIESKMDTVESDNYFISSLFYRVLWDRRDSKLNAKNGYLASFYIENARKEIGSDIEYIKSIIEFRAIKSYGDFTGAFKIKVGTIDNEVPIFKHFFTGGAFTNRGYKYRDVGEKDSDGKPYGGTTLLNSMLELRYSVSKNFSLATFVDASMLNSKVYEFGSDFSNSYGFGIRYLTPIGPIRFDVGFPQDRDDFRFNFSIGQAF